MWLACRLIGALFRDSAIFVLDVLFTVTCSQTLYFLFKVRQALVERLRFTFTPNGKREFVPRDQVFPLFFVYCLLLLHKNK